MLMETHLIITYIYTHKMYKRQETELRYQTTFPSSGSNHSIVHQLHHRYNHLRTVADKVGLLMTRQRYWTSAS